jgi:hypothetical protein
MRSVHSRAPAALRHLAQLLRFLRRQRRAAKQLQIADRIAAALGERNDMVDLTALRRVRESVLMQERLAQRRESLDVPVGVARAGVAVIPRVSVPLCGQWPIASITEEELIVIGRRIVRILFGLLQEALAWDWNVQGALHDLRPGLEAQE